MLPPTSRRVEEHTSDQVNLDIRRRTEKKIHDLADAGAVAINERLRELDREWDIERTLETNAASLVLIGLGLGTLVSKKWYVLPAVVSGFLLQHALQGWCPPLPLFRRRGVRTAAEIHAERHALKALRGDFGPVYERSADGKGLGEKAIAAAFSS